MEICYAPGTEKVEKAFVLFVLIMRPTSVPESDSVKYWISDHWKTEHNNFVRKLQICDVN